MEGGDIKPVIKSEIGAVSRRLVAMRGFDNRRMSQFVAAKPVRDEELTVSGMSGGIVVEFDVGKAVRDFRLVGIQSGQTYKEQRDGRKIATGFFVNDAMLAVDSVRRKLTSG